MAVSALPQKMDALARRAATLRDALRRSQGNTDGMVAILGSFDHRLSALEAAMRPTQVRPPPSLPLPYISACGISNRVMFRLVGGVAGEDARDPDGAREHRQDDQGRRRHPQPVRPCPPGGCVGRSSVETIASR
jgi:hypothetical protein